MSALKISEHQAKILRKGADDMGSIKAGRFGWSTSSLKSLERKGMVTLVSKNTWDSEWKITAEAFLIFPIGNEQ